MNFSKRMERFPDEIFASLNEKTIALQKQGRTLYNMFVGIPDFETPKHIHDALCEAAKDPANWKYTLRDCDELVQAVIHYYHKRFHVDLTPDMIASCPGSQEGMAHIGMVLADEGDTCILPTPCYPAFITCANMAGLTPFYYPMTKETNFLPDVSTIPDDVADWAKFMIVSLPSNPTGSIGNDENYMEIIAWAKKHNILIIHDNAYSDIIFDGIEGKSFLQYSGAIENGVEFFSLSKSFDVTGARLSFLVGNPEVVQMFKKLRSQYDFGMFMPLQKAAIAALEGPLDMVEEQKHKYQERRDALCGGLRSIGWDVPDSKGTMFVWAPIPSWYKSSMQFCLDLMDKSGVICTPGSSFGPLGEGYVRFALVLPPEKIKKAVQAIQDCGILNHD